MENLSISHIFPLGQAGEDRRKVPNAAPREQSGRPRTEEVLAGVRPESQTAGDGRCLAREVHPAGEPGLGMMLWGVSLKPSRDQQEVLIQPAKHRKKRVKVAPNDTSNQALDERLCVCSS